MKRRSVEFRMTARVDHNTCIQFEVISRNEELFYKRPVSTSARTSKDCTTVETDFYLCDDVVFPKTVLLFKNGRSTNDTREQRTCPGSNQGDVITNESGESPNQCVT